MTWTATALSTANIDSTSDSLATGLAELKTAVDRVSELSAHPTLACRTAMALVAQSVVQVVSTSSATWLSIPGSTAANRIPLDDTLPQISEGYSVISQAFTPKSASSTILIMVTGHALCTGTTIGDSATAALFVDSSSSALFAMRLSNAHTANAAHTANLDFSHYVSSGTTAARTFSLRVGPNTSTGNVYINGSNSARLYGGASLVRLTLIEFV